MLKTYNASEPPPRLLEYLAANFRQAGFSVRRRCVLTRSDDSPWFLVCCIVQAYAGATRTPAAVASRRYPKVILFEDWLDRTTSHAFIADIQIGKVMFGDIEIERNGSPNWQSEFVPAQNSFMPNVGFVARTRFELRNMAMPHDPLLASKEPYYPDASSAAYDWLALTEYHGFNDARNSELIFLLPEARAFFTSATSENGMLKLAVAGSDVGTRPLLVKGAYWEGSSIRHFESPLADDQVALPVPNEVDRLEYMLLDDEGEIFDFQREAWGNHTGLVRKRVGTIDDAIIQQIHDARETGECEEIEFKPFVEPDKPIGPVDKKSKLREIIRTIAAFANTRGGCVYLGIDDDCNLVGIQHGLAAWGKAEAGEDLFTRYKGALTNKIRGELIGDARFRFAFASIDGAVIAAITVSKSEAAPVGLKDEGYFYVRRGSSNRYLSPNEWPVASK